MKKTRAQFKKSEDPGDDDLMLELAKGNKKAFDILFSRYKALVFGYSLRILKNNATAEDVSQEIWFKVVDVAPQYSPSDQFVPWILTMTRRRCFNVIRDQKHEESVEDFEIFERPPEDVDHASIETLLARQTDALLVRQAIDELSDNQRILLVAWMTEEMSYEELAREFNMTLPMVKSLLFRAKQSLEKKLKGHGA